MKNRLLILILLVMMIFTTNVFAGWVLTERDTGDLQKTWYIQNNKIKISESNQIQIFDLNKNIISIANPVSKTFWSGTPEEFAAQGRKTLGNIEETIEQQMAWMPKKEREAFKNNMLGQMRKDSSSFPRINIKPANDIDKVAGYEVRKYEIWVNGQIRWEQWLSRNIMIDREFDIKRFGNMMRTFQSGFGHSDGTILWSPEVMNVIASNGWFLRTVYFEEEEGAFQVDEIARVEKRPLPDSIFDIPANYRRMPITKVF